MNSPNAGLSGHVNINRALSTTRSYLSLLRSGGQRIFVELAGGYQLLDVPSAYEMTPNSCRWVYKHAGGMIQVRSWAATGRHELGLSIEVLAGALRRQGEPRRLRRVAVRLRRHLPGHRLRAFARRAASRPQAAERHAGALR